MSDSRLRIIDVLSEIILFFVPISICKEFIKLSFCIITESLTLMSDSKLDIIIVLSEIFLSFNFISFSCFDIT